MQKKITLNTLFFRIFLQILCANLKNCEHESCLLYETLQLLFWAKLNLSYGLDFVFSDLFSIFLKLIMGEKVMWIDLSFHVQNLTFFPWLQLDFGLL